MKLSPKLPANSRLRNGFTMIEVMVAVVLLNLLVVGIVKLFIGQNAMVEDLEGWAEGEPVLYFAQDANPVARQLGIPAQLTPTRPPLLPKSVSPTPYLLEVQNLQRMPEADALIVVVKQTENEAYDEE